MRKYLARKSMKYVSSKGFKRTAYYEHKRNRIILTRGGIRL